MKSILLLSAAVMLVIESKAQKIIVLAEMRHGNMTQVDWNSQRESRFTFTYANGTSKISDERPKETYYNVARGTEIRLFLDSQIVSVKKDVSLKANFKIRYYKDDRYVQSEKNYLFGLSDCELIGNNVYKLKYAFLLRDPETISLVIMMNSINEKLFEQGDKSQGYSETVNLLGEFDWDRPDRYILFDTLLKLYRLSDYLYSFIEDNSFFNSELHTLQLQINKMNDAAKSDNKPEDRIRLMENLNDANYVFRESVQLKSKMDLMFLRLKHILSDNLRR